MLDNHRELERIDLEELYIPVLVSGHMIYFVIATQLLLSYDAFIFSILIPSYLFLNEL